jgi:hypothetical protein
MMVILSARAPVGKSGLRIYAASFASLAKPARFRLPEKP